MTGEIGRLAAFVKVLAFVLVASAVPLYLPAAYAGQSEGGDTGVYLFLDPADSSPVQPQDVLYGDASDDLRDESGGAAGRDTLPQTGDALEPVLFLLGCATAVATSAWIASRVRGLWLSGDM